MNHLFKFSFLIFSMALLFNSCVEEDFDQPPVTGTNPDLVANTTIAELLALHTLGGPASEIKDDLIIKGVVVADDFSGNWFRSFVLQDETAGVTVLIDLTESYFFYPVGREVFIKLNGLSLNDYNNLPQLGEFNPATGEVEDISDIAGHITRGVNSQVPAPNILTIDELSQNHVNTLIQLDEVIFTDTFGTYADVIGQNSLNVDLADCNGSTVIVRTSGFADFAGESVAKGGGTLVGVLSIFRDDYQLLIRDLSDLQMDGQRCGGGTGNPCGGGNPTVVTGVEEDFENGSDNDAVAVNGWLNIATKGSRSWQFKDFDNNIYCQGTAFNDTAPEMETWLITPFIDMDEAKDLSFETAKAFWTHDGLSVWVSTDFDCDPTTAIWQPINATIAQQNDDDHAFIPSGNIDLSGLVGNQIVIGFKYVGSGPNGLTSSYRIDNVKIGEGGGVDPTDPCIGVTPVEVGSLNVDFQNGSNNDPVVINGWTNVATKGDRNWIYKEFSGNVYTQATAFNDTAPETQTWLVTPLLDLNTDKILTFETAKAFWTHDGMTVWISTDFVCDPTAANWVPLNAVLAGQADADHDWVPSGDIDLSGLTGNKVAVGFKYDGNNNSGLTTSYRVDNVMLQ